MTAAFAPLLLLAAQAGPVADVDPVDSDEDIVVTAERLHHVEFEYKVKDWRLKRCKITQTTGNRLMDKAVCETLKACVAERRIQPREIGQCVIDHKADIQSRVDALKAAR